MDDRGETTWRRVSGMQALYAAVDMPGSCYDSNASHIIIIMRCILLFDYIHRLLFYLFAALFHDFALKRCPMLDISASLM